jgi:hypothetical protein
MTKRRAACPYCGSEALRRYGHHGVTYPIRSSDPSSPDGLITIGRRYCRNCHVIYGYILEADLVGDIAAAFEPLLPVKSTDV